MVGKECFSLLHNVQIGPGVHPASYPLGTTGYFFRDKVTEVDLSPPSSAEVRNGGVIPPLSHTSSWHHA
jgi:hypothetical protein